MAQSIKVAVRARPLNERELELDCPVVVSMQDKTVTVQCGDKGPKHFTYDYAYCSIDPASPSYSSQENIFDDIGAAMLSNGIEGFNGTLFAYGQTGSGKSYTMMGPPEEEGMIPRMITSLFQRKAAIERDPDKELQVWVSYIEIYKERLLDLFDAMHKQEPVKIMEHPKLGVYVRGAQEVPCETKEDVLTNLDYGLKQRSIASTNMNNASSRSHAAFCIRTTSLEGKRRVSGRSAGEQDQRKGLHAKINLIDLAGSERTSKAGTRNDRLKEGSAINQSLSALGIVIKTLSEKKGDQVAFRTSKLTFLLKDSLAGNSATYMMAAVSPASDNLDETLSTLRFASSVKTIQTVPVQNKDKKDQLIDALQEEMKLLKAQLAAGGINSEEAMEQLRERERLIKEKLQMDFQEDLRAAKEFQRARMEALETNGLCQQHITQAFGISNGMPYLVNMAFDPMLAGCLIYLIKESSPTTIGAHKDNTIVLNGLGVPDYLCRIEHGAGSGGTSILRLCEAGRVGVNGKMLKPGERLPIRHGDKVYLGRAFVLKLVSPRSAAGTTAGPLGKRDLLLECECDADLAASLENSPSWASLEMYIDQVLRQMPKTAATKFLNELKMTCRLTDEANELTSEFRREENLHLEVDITSSVPPCVVVRVLVLPPGKDCQDESAWETKYLWSAGQLTERLDRMRDYCAAAKVYGHSEVDPLEDPWYEAEPMEISQRLRHLGNVAEEAYNSMQHQLGSRVSWRSDGSILRIFFGFWKSSVSAWKHERKATGEKNMPGRLGLVKSNGPNGKMRATIIPTRSLQVHQTTASSRGKVLKPPEETPRKKVAAKSKVQSGDPTPEISRGNMSSKVAMVSKSEVATRAAVNEAPEATPEVVSGSACAASVLEPEEVAALRQELAMASKAARLAEAQVLQLNQDKEALQRRLNDKQEHIEKLSNQLEVAWQLSSVLRDKLIARKSSGEDAGSVAPTTTPVASTEPDLPDVLITAEALAATVRSVTAAARTAQEIRAHTGGGSSSRSSPQRMLAPPVQLTPSYPPVTWCGNPLDASTASPCVPSPLPPTLHVRRPRSPSPAAMVAHGCALAATLAPELRRGSPTRGAAARRYASPARDHPGMWVAAAPSADAASWRSGSMPGNVALLVPAASESGGSTSSCRPPGRSPQLRSPSPSAPQARYGSPFGGSCGSCSLSPPHPWQSPVLAPPQVQAGALLTPCALNLSLSRHGSPTSYVHSPSDAVAVHSARSSLRQGGSCRTPRAPSPAPPRFGQAAWGFPTTASSGQPCGGEREASPLSGHAGFRL